MPSKKKSYETLSRRERQVMQIVYRLGRVSAADVQANLDDPPSDSAVRTHLKILVEKGQLKGEFNGPRRIYTPTVSKQKVASSALSGLLRTFYGDSREQLFAALLDEARDELSADELDRLAGMIDEARKDGR